MLFVWYHFSPGRDAGCVLFRRKVTNPTIYDIKYEDALLLSGFLSRLKRLLFYVTDMKAGSI